MTGVTIAHCLATYGLADALETIIELDKKALGEVDSSGFTPLHCAAKFGQIECIKVLLRGGADIKSLDSHQRNAKFYCLLPEGRALLEGSAVINEVDGLPNGKKSKKKKAKSKDDPKRPRETIRRFQKSMTSRQRKPPGTAGAVCSKILYVTFSIYLVPDHNQDIVEPEELNEFHIRYNAFSFPLKINISLVDDCSQGDIIRVVQAGK